ncbi:MAG: VWA domain-containing protein [Candidatus Obscuribacterales bacterium]|nr:VWA domain-containing protein [Candidatus Obscuribacterales bacterium]
MRKQTGAIALALNVFIAIFVVGSLGIVSYEMSRILLAREQLTHCLQLAALGGGAEMASSSTVGAAAQANAATMATFILQKNSILGQSLANDIVTVSSPVNMNPTAGQIAIAFEFDDPITKMPSATGNVMKVYGTYAYNLFSGGFGAIGVGVYALQAQAQAGLPSLDLEIVYDSSSSMDDQTPVTMVRRYWDYKVPSSAYLIPPGGGGGGLDQGPISGLVCSPPFGSALNAIPPQNLDAAGDPKVTPCPKEFSEVGNAGRTVPLRGITNSGSPPGDTAPGLGGVGIAGLSVGPGNTKDSYALLPHNLRQKKKINWLNYLCHALNKFRLEQPAEAHFSPGFDPGDPAYNPWGADPTMFTDMVVNIDGNNAFGGYTGSGVFAAYPFPTIDFLVEAARGNMESNGIAPNTYTDWAIGSAAQPGYQQAYLYLAYLQLQPKTVIESTVRNFMTKLLQTSDCHFGFVAYNNRAGLSVSDTDTAPTVSWAYNPGNALNTSYLIPQVPLSTASNNYAAVTSVLTPPSAIGTMAPPLFTPNGGSNLADGLTQAVNNLTGPNSRTGAMKAIVVITDTVPSRDLAGTIYKSPGSNGPAINDALTVARAANTAGIPIFVVALDQSQGAAMTPYFTSQFSDTAAGGLVYTAGNGGALYIDTWSSPAAMYTTLTGSFNNVVRQLMTLTKGTLG